MRAREATIGRYRDYLNACNRRDWDEVGRHVAETVLVNGQTRTRREYVADIMSITVIFPDYRWELQRALMDGEWLAVHLSDIGTRMRDFLGAPGDGTRVATDEFDMYHIVDGLIREVEGTADNARLRI